MAKAKVDSGLKLRLYGDAVLKKKALPVAAITDETRDLAKRMMDAMFAQNGIGLAAPQIGVGQRLIIVACVDPNAAPDLRASPGERLLAPLMPLALVNPEIIDHGKEESPFSEGCLSVPEIYADVVRPEVVTLKATLLDGSIIQTVCGGLLSRCLQHEVDHLDGILFVDRLAQGEKDRVHDELAALKAKNRVKS